MRLLDKVPEVRNALSSRVDKDTKRYEEHLRASLIMIPMSASGRRS